MPKKLYRRLSLTSGVAIEKEFVFGRANVAAPSYNLNQNRPTPSTANASYQGSKPYCKEAYEPGLRALKEIETVPARCTRNVVFVRP